METENKDQPRGEVNTKPKPSIGRIVHYKSRGSADGVFPPTNRAAIITDVREEVTNEGSPDHFQCRVCVLNPEGIFFSDWLNEGDQPGNWGWPERV